MADAGAPADHHAATLDALRVRGAHRLVPVRFRLAEALARRAASHHGAAREVLDDKLAVLLQALVDQADQADQAEARGAKVTVAVSVSATARPATPRGALAELVAHVAGRRPAALATAPVPGSSAAGASTVDPEVLQFFRRTWSRLNADQRLAQSRSTLPDNAGPLNSHQLVHRALAGMRELSPEYFDHFIAHVDALLWLERAQAARESGLPPRSKGPKKNGSARRG